MLYVNCTKYQQMCFRGLFLNKLTDKCGKPTFFPFSALLPKYLVMYQYFIAFIEMYTIRYVHDL